MVEMNLRRGNGLEPSIQQTDVHPRSSTFIHVHSRSSTLQTPSPREQERERGTHKNPNAWESFRACVRVCRIDSKLRGKRRLQSAAMAGATGAAATKDAPAEDPKVDVFEDDDEFEEFENEVWDDEDEGKGAVQQWEDDWDDDDVTDDFSVQLKKELEAEK
jgi:26 proteasome complex subunit DSS1